MCSTLLNALARADRRSSGSGYANSPWISSSSLPLLQLTTAWKPCSWLSQSRWHSQPYQTPPQCYSTPRACLYCQPYRYLSVKYSGIQPSGGRTVTQGHQAILRHAELSWPWCQRCPRCIHRRRHPRLNYKILQKTGWSTWGYRCYGAWARPLSQQDPILPGTLKIQRWPPEQPRRGIMAKSPSSPYPGSSGMWH